MTTTTGQPFGHASRLPARTPLWAKIFLVLVVGALVAGATVAGVSVGKVLGAQESRDTQVVRSITGEEQVILLTAGMTDVKEERSDGLKVAIGDLQLFTLPGSDRSTLVRYEYDAKFGIEGKDVGIEPGADNSYIVTIPKFISLGYSNPDLSIASEKNGALSWTTPEIDTSEVFEGILDDQALDAHIDGFRPALEEQAKTFYTRIVAAIDPTIRLEFRFS